MMTESGKLRVMRLLACGVAVSVFGLLPGGPAQAQAQSEKESTPAVTVARVTNACFTETAYFTGTVVAREELFVMAEVEGARIGEVLVEEGDKVTPGQPLAKVVRPPATPAAGRNGTRWRSRPPASSCAAAPGLGGIASAASPEPLFRIARNGEIEVEADIPGGAPGQGFGRADRAHPGAGRGRGHRKGALRRARDRPPDASRRARISLGTDPRIRFGSTVTGSIETGAAATSRSRSRP
jgi:hypothetical protein